MSGYVVMNEYNALLSDPHSNGTGSSWTRELRKARRFPSEEAAQRECCENERAVSVESLLRPY